MRAKNHWKPWTPNEERRLMQLADQKVAPHAIADELDRSVNAVRNKARCLGILLPLYNRRQRITYPTANSTSGSQSRGAMPMNSGNEKRGGTQCPTN